MSRRTIADVQATLEIVNGVTGGEYWAAYESGRAHIFLRTYGSGRSTVFSGTARECGIFADGMRETLARD